MRERVTDRWTVGNTLTAMGMCGACVVAVAGVWWALQSQNAEAISKISSLNAEILLLKSRSDEYKEFTKEVRGAVEKLAAEFTQFRIDFARPKNGR